jgi:two-component system phosphate regulon sensor histidine kinase PhoR
VQNPEIDNTEQQEIEERERALTELRRLLLDRELATQSLRSSLNDNEETIQGLRESIVEQESAVNAMREANARRDEELSALQEKLAARDTDSSYKVALALTLANVAYDALLVLDESYHIVAINDAAEALFEVKRPIGEHVTKITDKPELEYVIEDAIGNEEEMLEEQMIVGKRSYKVRVKVIRRDGNFFIGVAFEDVTELVRLNRARRDMVANISHELRTPIANIRLIIESLFHEQEKPKRKQSTSALRAIARETDSLLWLVQELLDLSMIESGQAILRMVETSLNVMVDEAIERMEDQSETKEVIIVSEVPPDMMVLADADQARRVLLNLIHNAIKWSPNGGSITITAEPQDDEVIIDVLDNGPGVPEELKERIFERFYQVDPSRSQGEGSGLGLAICKHIVEAHGGRIWAEDNQHASGGRFRFTLPLA